MSEIYATAAAILDDVIERRAGLKTLLYSSNANPGQFRQLYALVSESIKCTRIARFIFTKTL